jgi:hypothetical protein
VSLPPRLGRVGIIGRRRRLGFGGMPSPMRRLYKAHSQIASRPAKSGRLAFALI